MAITLQEAKVGMSDKVDQQIVDMFRRSSFLLENMVFDNVISPGTGGSTLTYGYIQLKTPSTAGVRTVGAEYTPGEAKREQKTTDAIIMGGSFQVDRVLQNTAGAADELAFQAEQKIKATANYFHNQVINGTKEDGSFDGLKKLLTGTANELSATVELGSSAQLDENYNAFLDEMDAFLATLDGAPSALLMNRAMLIKLRSIARRAGYYERTRDDFGRTVETYAGIPMVDTGKALCDQNGYTALFGHVVDNGETVDEAVALVFRAPKSYTGEDTVELSVHGGSYVVRRVLRAVLSAGAVMADRGEFTRRAFTNGKINLTEAEAVIDIISADGEQALRASMAAKGGAIFKKCAAIKEDLTFAAATVAAFSDFPDEEPEFSGIDRLEELLSNAENGLDRLLEDYDTGRLLRHGINTVIVGPPNAGKSTLMNLLVGCERSIVTSVAGTTRDIIEESVNLDGIVLKLSDTAGLRETDDEVEQIGVRLTREKIDTADLIIAVVDSQDSTKHEIADLLDGIKGRPAVVVFNKSDIMAADTSLASKRGLRFVEMSAKDGLGVDEFKSAVREVTGTANLTGDTAVYLNERQRDCAERSLSHVREALETLQYGMTVDAVGVCLDDALNDLFELTGERVTVEVANKVFEHFCVGK